MIIETPYAARPGRTVEANLEYARLCCLDSISRGEAPFASHLLYTQFLDDTIREQRFLGMLCGFNWIVTAEATIVYEDYGVSQGMLQGIEMAEKAGVPIERRRLIGG